MPHTVRTAVLDFLRAHGLTTVFGNPGSTELPFLRDFPDDLRYVLGLQEAVVTGLADGYAQATGRPALVNLHTAPGVGNAMGAIVTAASNHTPLVITAGQQVRAMMTMEALLTNADPTALPRPAVKFAYEPPRPQDVPAALARALHTAMTPPRGPVFVSLPMDDFDVELDGAAAEAARAVTGRRTDGESAASADAVARLAERIAAAANPVLVTGGSVDGEGAWDAAVALAEKAGLPVWASPIEGRVGFPENHPHFRGVLPPALAPLAQALTGHDLVVVCGAPVFRYYPYVPGPVLPPGAELVLLTSDPAEAARAPAGDAVVAGLRPTLTALAELVPERPVPPRPAPGAPAPEGDGSGGTGSGAGSGGTGPGAGSGTDAGAGPRTNAAPDSDDDPAAAPAMPASALMAAVAAGAPANTLWVNESPSNIQAFRAHIPISAPNSFLMTTGGGLGFGLAAAVGAQLGAPDRPVVAVIGDGSAQYAITALWTAAAYRVPVTFVIPANHEYAILKWFAGFEKTPGVPALDIPGLDLCALARGYGVTAHRADTPADVTGLVRAATTGPRDTGPVLIEVPITSELPVL
ncbi:benzoylformate decarboxylase [Streptomyces sp. A7024]|uniref:Benzoylformate decarboxylase n=1 Tax=Streptomyces coryli TaxID=1128680 RepID=A0A6G4U6Z9_9ACTN|nr:benzoylformate decarboxylase [Streptomyces coryli]NGN67510.1 benzoylformate decarboxylase [Streptomyces coryli]